MTDIVNKLWSYCHVLRHDGIDYGDYLEQLTYLLFLKMADERDVRVPDLSSWRSLTATRDVDLLIEYERTLVTLAGQPGTVGAIFRESLSQFSNAESLRRLLKLIDEIHWSTLDADIQAEAFEGLLERAAAEGKKGAGQYFTPRALVQSIVSCLKPDPTQVRNFAIGDPACGTGGFLVESLAWMRQNVPKPKLDALSEQIQHDTFFGTELVARPRRLGLMNLLLHGVEAQISLSDAIYGDNALSRHPLDVVLTNPPFGTKGVGQVPDRPDFPIATNNKQLNFLQHVISILKPGGRAAVVVPDSVLFGKQARAVLRQLSTTNSIHTVLRCAEGTFSPYTAGTRTNVLFSTQGRPSESTWIYDARTNTTPISRRSNPLVPDMFVEFETCYGMKPDGTSPRSAEDSPAGRWRSISASELTADNFNIATLSTHFRTDSQSSDGPHTHLELATENTRSALANLKKLMILLDGAVERE